MKITIWSDFVCPFCFIGQAHLDEALADFEHKDQVEIEYKSFLLMPEVNYVPGKSYVETFAESKGLPLEQAQQMLNQVTAMAKHSGVDIDYDIAKLSSTVDAHCAFQYAKEQGKGTEFFKRFYAAHFTEGELLSDVDTIVRLAEEVGLDGSEVRQVIETGEHKEEVDFDLFEAQSVGVQGVPFFVFNNKYAVSGAQPVEAFKQFLKQVWADEQQN